MKSSFLVAAILTLAPAARAGGLDQRAVPRDARWVAHLDVEAMAKSEFLLTLREDGTDLAREFNLDELEREFGVDPLRDLTSLTFVGCGTGQQDFALVVRGGARLEAAWSTLIERTVPPTRIGARNVYKLGAGRSVLEATMASKADASERTIVLATTDAALAAELAALDGSAPALDPASSAPIATRPSKGAIFFAAGSTASRRSIFSAAAWNVLEELAALERAEMDRIATNAQALVFELGEEDGSLITQLALNGESAQSATDMAQVLRDSLARLSRSTEGTPAGTYVDRLARALRIETAGSRMKATFRYRIRELVADVARAEELLGIRKAR